MIYKLLPTAAWQAARAAGSFEGSEVDLADGFVHFSTAAQVAGTAARHFAGQSGLTMLTVDGDRLADLGQLGDDPHVRALVALAGHNGGEEVGRDG